MVGAEVASDSGGTGGEANGSELQRAFVGEDAGFAETVLQAAVLLVDGLQFDDFVVERAVEVDEVGVCCLGKVAGDSAGDYGFEKVACSEGFHVGAQQVFFEARELGEAEGESGVVAESS